MRIENGNILFDSEDERMQHPAGQLIPFYIWSDLKFFDSRLTPLDLYALTEPLATLSIDREIAENLHEYKRLRLLIVYLIRFPQASYQEILAFTKQACLYTSDIFNMLVVLDQLPRFNDLIKEFNLSPLSQASVFARREFFPPHEYDGFLYAVSAGFAHILPWFEEHLSPRIFKEMLNSFLDEYQQFGPLASAFYDAVAKGHLSVIQWITAKQEVDGHFSPEEKAMQQMNKMAELFDYHIFFVAAKSGQMHILLWLKESMSPDKFKMVIQTKAPVILKERNSLPVNIKVWLEEQMALIPHIDSDVELVEHVDPRNNCLL